LPPAETAGEALGIDIFYTQKYPEQKPLTLVGQTPLYTSLFLHGQKLAYLKGTEALLL